MEAKGLKETLGRGEEEDENVGKREGTLREKEEEALRKEEEEEEWDEKTEVRLCIFWYFKILTFEIYVLRVLNGTLSLNSLGCPPFICLMRDFVIGNFVVLER